MAAPPRAAPAIIDNATVYRVFMITPSQWRAEHQHPRARLRSCFAHVRARNRRNLDSRRLQPLAVTKDTHRRTGATLCFATLRVEPVLKKSPRGGSITGNLVIALTCPAKDLR